MERLREVDRLVEEHSGLDGDEYFEQAAQKIEERLGIADTAVTDISPESRRRFKGLWWKVTAVAASVAVLTFIGLHQEEIFQSDDLMQRPETKSESPVPATPSEVATDSVIEETAGEKPPSLQALEEKAEEVMPETGDEDYQQPIEREKQREAEDIRMPEPVTESRSPEPPPAPAARSPRAPATTALQDEGEPEAASDDNYRRSVLDESVSPEVRETSRLESGGAESVTADMAKKAYESVRELTFWVARRDSLAGQIAEVRKAGTTDKPSRVKGLNALAPTPTVKDTTAVRDSLEAGLLETWFRIAQLSTDSLEISSSRDSLKRVATDSTSVNSSLAAEYLRRLSNK
jgi:hypothetical protein